MLTPREKAAVIDAVKNVSEHARGNATHAEALLGDEHEVTRNSRDKAELLEGAYQKLATGDDEP